MLSGFCSRMLVPKILAWMLTNLMHVYKKSCMQAYWSARFNKFTFNVELKCLWRVNQGIRLILWRACNLSSFSPCLTGPVDYLFASHHKGPGSKSPGGFVCETGIFLLAMFHYNSLVKKKCKNTMGNILWGPFYSICRSLSQGILLLGSYKSNATCRLHGQPLHTVL